MVGTVREIFEAPDSGGGDWYWASVELTYPPGWLKRNGGVSWSHNALQTQDVNGTTRLLRGLITEVSILSPSVEPAEPRARVAWIGESQRASAAGPSSDRPVAGEVIYGDGRTITRYFDNAVLAVGGRPVRSGQARRNR